MQSFRLKLLVLPALMFLSACGFTPLYQSGSDGQSGLGTPSLDHSLSTIEVAPISDRVGQQMRNHLLVRLNTKGTPQYQLKIILEQSTRGYGIRPDASITQEELTVKAHVSLLDLNTNEAPPLFMETYTSRTSYDAVLSDFATLTQREDSARRLAIEIADRIHRRMAVYFQGHLQPKKDCYHQ